MGMAFITSVNSLFHVGRNSEGKANIDGISLEAFLQSVIFLKILHQVFQERYRRCLW